MIGTLLHDWCRLGWRRCHSEPQANVQVHVRASVPRRRNGVILQVNGVKDLAGRPTQHRNASGVVHVPQHDPNALTMYSGWHPLTAGAVPLDTAGNVVGAGEVRAQARQTLDDLMRQLAAAGATGEDVLKTTVYVASTDRADLVAGWEAVQRSPIAAAASTLLGMALLGYPGQLQVVEIEAIAVLP